MKVFAIHDARGFISEIIAAPENGPTVGIAPRAGQTITQLNMQDHSEAFKDNESLQEFTDMIHKYRVVVESKIGKLERSSDVD